MEIERKFLIKKELLPNDLEQYPHNELEQAYLITEPVLRIRKKNDSYILTYKSKGLMVREEAEFPLPADAYETLLQKAEGNVITKVRYLLPDEKGFTIELDIFKGIFEGLYLAEVEFPDEETAMSYMPPAWFGTEVTTVNTFHNSTLSKMKPEDIAVLLSSLAD